jgi:IclR family acetate operon transcriptional repressor
LAYLPPAQQKEIAATIQFDQLTPRTIGSAEQLNEDLLKVRRRGYALDDEEAVVGARCISVPILTQRHVVIGAISISGPIVRITKRHVPEFATTLRAAADEIARQLSVLFS